MDAIDDQNGEEGWLMTVCGSAKIYRWKDQMTGRIDVPWMVIWHRLRRLLIAQGNAPSHQKMEAKQELLCESEIIVHWGNSFRNYVWPAFQQSLARNVRLSAIYRYWWVCALATKGQNHRQARYGILSAQPEHEPSGKDSTNTPCLGLANLYKKQHISPLAPIRNKSKLVESLMPKIFHNLRW